MRISYKGDYALKVILDLADNYPDTFIHIEDISRRQDIPQKYLEQILLTLKKGGFVQSKKGPNGGYFLTRAPREISLGEVVRFIEGPIYPISCVDPEAQKTCRETSTCVFCDVWKEVGDGIARIVDSIDFEQLKERSRKKTAKEVMYYSI